jgi:hypothetical protein
MRRKFRVKLVGDACVMVTQHHPHHQGDRVDAQPDGKHQERDAHRTIQHKDTYRDMSSSRMAAAAAVSRIIVVSINQ